MSSLTALDYDTKLSMVEVPDIVTVDTEGFKSMMGISLCFDGMPAGMYFPFDHAKGNMSHAQQKKLFNLLDKKQALVFHNAAHDLKVLARAGFSYRGKFYDTMLMAHWLNEERMKYSLDYISKLYGGQPKAMPESMSRLINSDSWHEVPVALMDDYSSNDAYITHQLFRKLLPDFEKEFPSALWEVEQEFIRDVMMPMMERGIKLDLEFCIKEWVRGQTIMTNAREELGFKPTSPVAMKKFLIDELGLPIVKHTKSCLKCYPPDKRNPAPVASHVGAPSFDKDSMAIYEEMLEHREDDRAKTILRYRGWLKTTSSNYKPYLDLADDSGCLHPGYKLHGTKTGRLSCAEPNLQQIPKSSEKDWNGNLKAAFTGRPGFNLWTVDYSQLQFRMTCAYASQDTLLGIFNDSSRDIFTEMAGQMGWVRHNVKTLVYLILFGGGANRASVAFNVSLEEGGALVNEFHSLYPEIKKVSYQASNAARRQGYVSLWTGRRRHFGRGAPYYRAFNAVIQGGEAEIIKRAMIALQKEVCDENCYMVLQIHDEIAFEIKEGHEDDYLPRIQKVMEAAGDAFCEFVGVKVAFKTSAGRWGQK